jgi:hypothetical protein
VVVALHEPRREAVAEEVAAAVVAPVERLRVGTVQALHAVGEAPELRLDDEVVVVRQQAERVDTPVVAPDLGGQQSQEEPALVVVEEDGGARDATGSDVVDAFGRKLATRSPHLRRDGSPGSGVGRSRKRQVVDDSSRLCHA